MQNTTKHKFSASIWLSVLLAFVMVLAACDTSSDTSSREIVSSSPSQSDNRAGLSDAQKELADKWVLEARNDLESPADNAEAFWAGMTCFSERVAGLVPDEGIAGSGLLQDDIADRSISEVFAEYGFGDVDYAGVGSAFRGCLLETNAFSEVLRLSLLEDDFGVTDADGSPADLPATLTEDVANSLSCLLFSVYDPYSDAELGRLLADDVLDVSDSAGLLVEGDEAVGRAFRDCEVLVNALDYQDAQIRSLGGEGLAEIERCLAVETFAQLSDEEIGRLVRYDDLDLEDEDDIAFANKAVEALRICGERASS